MRRRAYWLTFRFYLSLKIRAENISARVWTRFYQSGIFSENSNFWLQFNSTATIAGSCGAFVVMGIDCNCFVPSQVFMVYFRTVESC